MRRPWVEAPLLAVELETFVAGPTEARSPVTALVVTGEGPLAQHFVATTAFPQFLRAARHERVGCRHERTYQSGLTWEGQRSLFRSEDRGGVRPGGAVQMSESDAERRRRKGYLSKAEFRRHVKKARAAASSPTPYRPPPPPDSPLLDADAPELTYYIGEANRVGCSVKIGITTNLASRLKAIQTSQPREMLVLAVELGGQSIECDRHRYFQRCHERGEWYRIDEELHQHIKKMRGETSITKFMEPRREPDKSKRVKKKRRKK